MTNPQYDYDYGPDGVLAPLQARAEYPQHPGMIAPPIGWVELVLNLDSELSHLVPDYTVLQVKEKFAGLRYYIGTYGVGKDDPRVEIAKELIAEAEAASHTMCQICGEPGERDVETGIHVTLCEEHNTGRLWGG